MKQLEGILGIVFFTFVFLLYPALSRATPLEVTLFPASAQVLEIARLKVVPEGNLKKAIFTLPAQADPDSLVTRADAGGKVRIEEPVPRNRDERIKIAVKNGPAISEEKNAFWIWMLEVPAGQKKSILTTVSLEAPKEMDLDLGWRK